jgi:hypothetical protein
MDDGWSPYYVLICDDIRLEVTGKQILIGTYNEIIVAPSFPAPIMLAFRVAVRMHRIGFNTCEFRLLSPNGTTLFANGGEIHAQTIDEHVSFAFQNAAIIFPDAGEYSIEFGLDGDVKKVGRLRLRLPENDEERRKFNP